MRQETTSLTRRDAAELAQDAIGALSLCVTFLAVLFLPGLF